LINHIQHDDQDYVNSVRENMLHYLQSQEKKKEKAGFHDFSNKNH
jgi:hemerythrin